jgi:hypothetical protein
VARATAVAVVVGRAVGRVVALMMVVTGGGGGGGIGGGGCGGRSNRVSQLISDD